MKPPDRLVVDANPILSTLLGGQARRVFFESAIREFAVPERVISEVRRYVPRLAQKLGVRQAFLEYALNLLPLRVYPARRYARAVPEARRRIEQRDPTDVDVLALALHLGVSLWSNDRDFEDAGVSRFTTAELLAILFEHRGP
ncbi:MAG: PIN domain-containing protein [Gemmatimonadales bacterium]